VAAHYGIDPAEINVIGRHIGKHLIVEEINNYSRATVYRTDANLMLQVYSKGIYRSASFSDLFYECIAPLREFTHPAIVPVLDIGETNDVYYFAIPHTAFPTLGNVLDDMQLLRHGADKVIEQLANVLEFVHFHDIIHGELTPDDIFIDDECNIFVRGFNMHRLSPKLSIGRPTPMFDPAYVSPELARGYPVDKQSDVYTLGVIAFHVLTGQLPYHGTSPIQYLLAHISNPVPSISERAPRLPASLDVVFKRAMAKNANDRYETTGEFWQAYREATANCPSD
jgi:serine/threonine-protein kinase